MTDNKAYERQDRYNKKNTKQVLLRFNLKTDADILARLEATENRQGYIKRLIRADIEANPEP